MNARVEPILYEAGYLIPAVGRTWPCDLGPSKSSGFPLAVQGKPSRGQGCHFVRDVNSADRRYKGIEKVDA